MKKKDKVMRNRMYTVTDAVVLMAGAFLTTWFYYELYQTFLLIGKDIN